MLLRAIAAAFVLLATLGAQQQPISALVFTLDGRYNSMHSWEADFVQVYTSGLETRTERGHLYLQKPGKMRWNYTAPVKKQFLVSGDKMWQYIAGDASATVLDLKQATDLRTPLRYLLGHLDLPKELNGLSYSGLAPVHPGDAVIHGVPADPETAGWSEVWIEVTPAYEIDRLVIASLDGSRNDIRMSNIHANARIPPGTFTFTPPPGVRVVPGGN